MPLKDLYSYGTNSKNNSTQKLGLDGNQSYYDTNIFSKYPANLDAFKSIFVELLNQERQNRGLLPVSVDSDLTKIANKRALDSQKINKLVHLDSAGNSLAAIYAKEAGLDVPPFSECLGFVENAPTRIVVRESLRDYIYQDAASDWGHRDTLLNPSYTHIGVGVTTAKNKMTVNAIEMY